MDNSALKLGGVLSVLILEYLTPQEHYLIALQLPHPQWRPGSRLSAEIYAFENDWLIPKVALSNTELQSEAISAHQHAAMRRLWQQPFMHWTEMYYKCCADCIEVAFEIDDEIPTSMIRRTIQLGLTSRSMQLVDRWDIGAFVWRDLFDDALQHDLQFAEFILKNTNVYLGAHRYIERALAANNIAAVALIIRYVDIEYIKGRCGVLTLAYLEN